VGWAGGGGAGPGLLRRRLRDRHHPADDQPGGAAGLHGAAFVTALHELLPALGAYALSFLILGQLWLAHHRIFGVIARVDYVVLRSSLLFLGLIALMPFPVRLLSDYNDRPLAVVIYSATFIAAMALQLVVWLNVTPPRSPGPAPRASLRRRPRRLRPRPWRHAHGVRGRSCRPAWSPRYAALVWALMIPLRQVVARFARRSERDASASS
jgi:TMEM175 potassium channel family protein